MTLAMNFCQGFDITPTIVHETITGNDDGSIELAVSGGVAGYLYNWSNGATTAAINNLADGIYTVTIVDDFGCEATSSYTIEEGGINTATNNIAQLNNFTIAPNPTNGHVSIFVDLNQQMEARLEVYDLTGKLVKAFPANVINQQQYTVDLSNYANGIYLAKLILDHQVVTKKITKI